MGNITLAREIAILTEKANNGCMLFPHYMKAILNYMGAYAIDEIGEEIVRCMIECRDQDKSTELQY